MTDRSKHRNIEPVKVEDIPFAWGTCDQRIPPDPYVEREGRKLFAGCTPAYNPMFQDFADCSLAKKQLLCCEALVRVGKCPRGYAR